MRKVLTILAFVSATLTVTPSAAEARRMSIPHVGGTSERLDFVAGTAMSTDDDGPLSLCYLVEGITVFGQFLTYEVQSYALAPNGCDSEKYFALTDEAFAIGQTAGDFPADLPPLAVTPDRNRMLNWVTYGVFAFLLLFALRSALRKVFGNSGKGSLRRRKDDLAVQTLAAMCIVSTCDGEQHPDEIRQISTKLAALTGKSYSPDQIKDMLDYTATDPSAIDAIGVNLTEKDRRIVMEAAMAIATADGRIDPAEYNAVTRIAQQLGMQGQAVREILQDIAAQMRGNTLNPA